MQKDGRKRERGRRTRGKGERLGILQALGKSSYCPACLHISFSTSGFWLCSLPGWQVVDTASKLYLILELGDGGDLYDHIRVCQTRTACLQGLLKGRGRREGIEACLFSCLAYVRLLNNVSSLSPFFLCFHLFLSFYFLPFSPLVSLQCIHFCLMSYLPPYSPLPLPLPNVSVSLSLPSVSWPTSFLVTIPYLFLLFIVLDLQKSGPLPEPQARDIFRQIAEAMDYCHRHRIAHRDLKPENVVFCSSPGSPHRLVKLTDFGLSNNYHEGEMMKTMCGSMVYSAPEVLLQEPYHGPAADVWSLGKRKSHGTWVFESLHEKNCHGKWVWMQLLCATPPAISGKEKIRGPMHGSC